MKKKLIEVALPLEAINKESAREKSIRHGHPSTLHLWWSRKPLATCRAVLFASLVDDPSSLPEKFPTEADQDRERARLFGLIEELVKWDTSDRQTVLKAARTEILASTDGNPPPVYDPFCGGGSIPLEAQRLGLEAHASDLNPVAVLVTRALAAFPQRFANSQPISPTTSGSRIAAPKAWTGARGLAEDIRYYGAQLRSEAEDCVGHLYPPIELRGSAGQHKATVIAWLFCRAVRCPNPACAFTMPLSSKFWLSTKPGKKAWVQPIIDLRAKRVAFKVCTGEPEASVSSANDLGSTLLNERGKKAKASFACLACNVGRAKGEYIDNEAANRRLSFIPMAIVAEGQRDRIFMDFDSTAQDAIDVSDKLVMDPTIQHSLPKEEARGTFASNAQGRTYGFHTFSDYFTSRQLITLSTFSRLVMEVRDHAVRDGASLEYADALATYLAFAVDKVSEGSNSLCTWSPLPTKLHVVSTFGRQGIAMAWDFAEANPFANSSGNFSRMVDLIASVIETNGGLGLYEGTVNQADATQVHGPSQQKAPIVSTDPPYYDNIGYADLSDFFYVWLRKSIGTIEPLLFSTLLTPKKQELIASPYRFEGSKERAKSFFEEGFRAVFTSIRKMHNADYPMSIYYAFKQSESIDEGGDHTGISSTGWETMLEGLIHTQHQVTGTWPVRTERSGGFRNKDQNVLASSIVLVCRPRPDSASITTRKDFLNCLKRELPFALRNLQKGNIAPVDLAQAAIGPGMAVFSRYKKVLETDGSPMRVRTALTLINQGLDEVLSEMESEFDPDTRWALTWFEQHQFDEGLYGEAEVLATAKALSISGLAEAGILHSRAGKVRLRRRDELPEDWDPASDKRLTVWEVTQHLIRRLDKHGETEAANLKAKIGGMAEIARDLAYRLYTLCERKGWAEEAGYYNSLVVAWPSMTPPELFQ